MNQRTAHAVLELPWVDEKGKDLLERCYVDVMLPVKSKIDESLVNAVDEVLAYASVFDHHLELEEVLRNLRVQSSRKRLEMVIEATPHFVVEHGVLFSQHHAKNENHAQSRALAVETLEQTTEVLSILNSCPQITGLAITGSVAAGVNAEGGDVDVLIITKPGWVWRVRALAIYLAHRHPRGRLLCPNMVMSEESLTFEESVYSAREMMQIVPLKDEDSITKLFEANPWTKKMLPNARRKPLMRVDKLRQYPWWWNAMKLPLLGRIIERWESSRRINELKESSKSTEAIYSKSVCRGHENSHKTRIESEYNHAMEAVL